LVDFRFPKTAAACRFRCAQQLAGADLVSPGVTLVRY
jgi:hypothetical protein